MKAKLIAALCAAAMALTACDDTTDTLGNTLTSHTDQFDIVTDTFNVSTGSMIADSVLSRSLYSYLGHVKDPETRTYVTSNYTSQFSVLERLDGDSKYFPDLDSLTSYVKDKKIIADSCKIRIYLNASLGDSLTPMRLTACELQKPVEENISYYSNFDPEADGYVRSSSAGGIRKNVSYTPLDMSLSDSIRNTMVKKTNLQIITIPLNQTYRDREGQTYNNYGTYVMRKYYAHPEYFNNSYSFIHKVCPGFYYKSTGGLGAMSEISYTDLQVYFRYESADSTYKGIVTFAGTEEVMQTTHIVNNRQAMENLVNDKSCTYLKSPAGIFTEVTLPVEDISRGHETDSISSARIVFTRYNNAAGESLIDAPSQILMVPKDSLYKFFEHKNLPDSKTSFLASLNTSFNTYTFNNISTLITSMINNKKAGRASADWNKVVLLPVTVTTSTTTTSSLYYGSSTTTTITNVANNMSLTSTRLVGGADNPKSPVTISVIYNKFRR